MLKSESLSKLKVLLTCPNMIKCLDNYHISNFIIDTPLKIEQKASEDDLIKIIAKYDIWIIGDDLATFNVIKTGSKGKLTWIIKWGIGMDNINLDACQKFNIKVNNTPHMFSEEVSDIAIGYIIMLARNLHLINEEVSKGNWFRPTGMSLTNKKVVLIGYGSIGKVLFNKLLVHGLKVDIYDPFIYKNTLKSVLTNADFIIITCALTSSSYHLLTWDEIKLAKKGVYIINVARGGIIKETDLITAFKKDWVSGVALDVFEEEPLPLNSELKNYNCIFGSHNASNTKEAVEMTNKKVIEYISDYISS